MSKRSSEKRITKTALIVRYMRQSKGLSLKQAGRLAGITGSAIAHIEAGRMDVSEGRLDALLHAYGCTHRDYRALVDGGEIPVSHLDECLALIQTLDHSTLQAVHAILVSLGSRRL